MSQAENMSPGPKTKVFHVITKLELGGAQKVTLMTLDRLPRDRYEVGLVSGPQGLLREQAEKINGLHCMWIPSLVRQVRPVKDLGAFIGMWKLFRRERPDIVHTHSSKAGILGRWAAWLAGVPVIFHTAHGFGFNDFQGALARAFYVGLEKITRLITTKPVMVSRANAARAESLGILRPGEWILCRDAISTGEFMTSEPRSKSLEAWGIPPDRVVVGMVACFKPQKSPVDFIDVAALVLEKRQDVHFVVAGDGDLRPDIEARIEEHGIGDHVTLLGWVSDMPEVYRNLDIFVLTSLWEGQPCVFAEAMASSLPIVATAADGAREAISEGINGYVHEPRDVAAMARSVVQLVEQPQLRGKMGAAGLERVHEFDIDTSVSRLDAAYREVLDRGGPAPAMTEQAR